MWLCWFSVDTAGAGEGELDVTIMHQGSAVPVQMQSEGRGMYRVNFTPSGSGVYTIKVFFAGMEVTGRSTSPLYPVQAISNEITNRSPISQMGIKLAFTIDVIAVYVYVSYHSTLACFRLAVHAGDCRLIDGHRQRRRHQLGRGQPKVDLHRQHWSEGQQWRHQSEHHV